MHLKVSSGKWRPFCLGLNVLIHSQGERYSATAGTEENMLGLNASKQPN